MATIFDTFTTLLETLSTSPLALGLAVCLAVSLIAVNIYLWRYH